ncbi:MAG: S8 family serine peptidase [Actinophytocola sp.]|uniref:S8 family serine peptidase n=1 Tax=Actinophytocola sp. TaxID=1872138 RepID=UPI003C776ADD
MTAAFPNGDRPRGEPPRRNPLIPDAIAIPPEILARHRARVLDPAVAVRPSTGERPYSTVYRSETLLVPAGDVPSLLPGPDQSEINRHLAEIGLELRPSTDENWQSNVGRLPPDLGVPVPLRRAEGAVADRAPDPWAALVWLRDKLNNRVKNYQLDHLLMPATVAVEGAPVSNGGAVGGVPVSNGGSVGGSIALYTGSRNPVAMLMPQPARPAPETLTGGRRPVVAVLDTGIGRHPWWDSQNPADPIIEVSQAFQDLLGQQEATDPSLVEPYPLDDPEEVQNLVQPLLGLLDSHAGHGTFVSGLVHQLCPAAKILSLRVLHSDGYSTEGALLLALNWLAERVESGDPAQAVDVVSLSLGFYAETTDPAQVSQVLNAINRLTSRGVLVVAAAGNDATTRPFLPAAFGLGTGSASGGVELLSAIGARNAPGLTTAAFSNWGEWVSRWAPGNALVSTVPVEWEGAASPGLAYPDPLGLGPWVRTAPDPDDLRSGFAVWAGTSFATPVVAGLLASALAHDEQSAKASDAAERAQQALVATDAELVRRHWQ